MQGIYTHIPETSYVPREHGVAAILLFLFMVLISLVSVLNLLYFYIITFRSMCAVHSMAVFCSALTYYYYYYYYYYYCYYYLLSRVFQQHGVISRLISQVYSGSIQNIQTLNFNKRDCKKRDLSSSKIMCIFP